MVDYGLASVYEPDTAVINAVIAAKPARILLVEDNDEHRIWIQDQLSAGLTLRFECRHAQSLADAITLLGSGKFDAAILDLGLPELSGYQSQLVIHMVAPGLPVIVLSGDDSPKTRELSRMCGAVRFLVKSEVNPKALADSVRAALTRAGI